MIAITFDTDHLSNESMGVFLGSFEFPGSVTFFCTKRYQVLREEQYHPHEITIHPVFPPASDWETITRSLAEEVGCPKTGVRPHSCACSQQYMVYLASQGYLYVSVATNLFQECLNPYYLPWGVWELPVYYMDNMDFVLAERRSEHRPFAPEVIHRAVSSEMLFVFDFHPIHMLRNTT